MAVSKLRRTNKNAFELKPLQAPALAPITQADLAAGASATVPAAAADAATLKAGASTTIGLGGSAGVAAGRPITAARLLPTGEGVQPVRTYAIGGEAGVTAGKTRGGDLDAEDGGNQTASMVMGMAGGELSGAFIQQVAAIGAAEGFRVKALVPDQARGDTLREQLTPAAQAALDTVDVGEKVNPWTEDSSATTADGRYIVPNAEGLPGMETWSRGLKDARAARIKADEDEMGMPDLLREPGDVGFQGAVALEGTTDLVRELAAETNRPVTTATSYVEGGNMLTGRRPDGSPFALVGKDSIEMTRQVLAKAAPDGRATDEQALAAIAEDYGLTPEQVVPVEQPGVFHLDMAISPLGGDRLVMNDAVAAQKLQAQWAREDYQRSKPDAPGPQLDAWVAYGPKLDAALAQQAAQAQKVAAWEERAIEDLEAAGFQVERMAGVFDKLTPDGRVLMQNMNFMNAEKGVGRNGDAFSIMLGGDPRAEQYVAQRMAQLVDRPTNLHFLDAQISDHSLRLKGGISCRVRQQTRYGER